MHSLLWLQSPEESVISKGTSRGRSAGGPERLERSSAGLAGSLRVRVLGAPGGAGGPARRPGVCWSLKWTLCVVAVGRDVCISFPRHDS